MNVLEKAFDEVAAGRNSKYWVALVLGYKGITPANLDGNALNGYRIGERLRAMGMHIAN